VRLFAIDEIREATEDIKSFQDAYGFTWSQWSGQKQPGVVLSNAELPEPGALQDYIGRSGGSGSLLHYGRKTTPVIQAKIEFEGDNSTTTYTIRLADAAPDTLIFTDEQILFQKTGFRQPQDILLGAGRKESLSSTASIRKGGYIEDAAYLRSDARNDENSEG